eukprot:CFRG1454T1
MLSTECLPTPADQDGSDFSSDDDESVGYSVMRSECDSDGYYSAVPTDDLENPSAVAGTSSLLSPEDVDVDALLAQLGDLDVSNFDLKSLSEGILGFLTAVQTGSAPNHTRDESGDTHHVVQNESMSNICTTGSKQTDMGLSEDEFVPGAETVVTESVLHALNNDSVYIDRSGADVEVVPSENIAAITSAMKGWAPPSTRIPNYLKNMDIVELKRRLFKDV